MLNLFYRFLAFFSKTFGYWIFIAAARVIAAGHFIFLPKRVTVSKNFYRSLFPEKNIFYHYFCVWKQYQNFTNIYFDRFMQQMGENIEFTSTGFEELEKSVKEKRGGIIVMSHFGNWDMAAHLLQTKGLPLMLFMGLKEKEQLEKMQKENLVQAGITIVAVETETGSPFNIIEAAVHLKQGKLLSLPGDQAWRKDSRMVKAVFAGHYISLPEAPHAIAYITGSPLYILLAERKGRKKYHFQVNGPFHVKAPSRKDKHRAIVNSAQNYAAVLEREVRLNPFQWYHFDRFLGEKINEKTG